MISLLFLHLFCLISDLFSIFIFQFFDILHWHIEQFNNKNSIHVPEWENEVSNHNQEHQELLVFQFQFMFISYQLLLSSQKKCQQRSVFLQHDQPSNTIDDLLTYVHKIDNLMQVITFNRFFSQSDFLSSSSDHFQSLTNIHTYFYDPIEIWLEENFQERVNVNKLLLVHTLIIDVHNVFSFIILV